MPTRCVTSIFRSNSYTAPRTSSIVMLGVTVEGSCDRAFETTHWRRILNADQRGWVPVGKCTSDRGHVHGKRHSDARASASVGGWLPCGCSTAAGAALLVRSLGPWTGAPPISACRNRHRGGWTGTCPYSPPWQRRPQSIGPMREGHRAPPNSGADQRIGPISRSRLPPAKSESRAGVRDTAGGSGRSPGETLAVAPWRPLPIEWLSQRQPFFVGRAAFPAHEHADPPKFGLRAQLDLLQENAQQAASFRVGGCA